MIQQINFLSHIPKPANDFSVKKLLLSMIACFLAFFLISLVIAVQIFYLSRKESTTLVEQREAVASYQQSVEKYPILSVPIPLGKRVLGLENRLAARKIYFSNLIHENSRLGFSGYMLALSNITPDSLWLNAIMIDQTNNNVSLKGLTQQPDILPLLLQGLQNSTYFNKIKFDLFYLKKQANRNNVAFEVANLNLFGKTDQIVKIPASMGVNP